MSKQPKLEIDEDGTKWWKLNGVLHREDGPAVEYWEGSTEWWLNGELHRVDGPAISYANEYKQWCLNGNRYSYDKWFQLLTPEQQWNYLWNYFWNIDEQ
jgi:hypothetical protein